MTFLPPLLTLVGVPAGLALTGGNVETLMTLTLAGWFAILALFARRWPLGVALLTFATMVGWRTSGLVDSGWIWPATAALAVLALAGRLRAAIAVCAVALLYGFGWDGFVDKSHGGDWTLAHVGGETLWLAAVLAAATAYRNYRRWRDEVAHRLAQDEHERALQARVEIARDLHDVVSHTLAVVGVHLNVALDAFDADPEEARESLKLAQDVRGRAMTDLKSMVGVLRAGSDPVRDLDGVVRLTDQVRTAGLEVSLTEFGDRTGVPAAVASTVYRVVQEALTNTVRHAGASRVTVTLRYAPDNVLVDVQDNGNGGADPATDGHGIAGMRERVAALGGALTAGPGRSGFTVRATIPFTA
ncbi:sensor histidine kinase [Paractinoplanes rishiriensis]|uniref:histidine kinase n=1 Tax=Paractinoplanes rishiriensis TaxID=1050105 RepID=A0A919JTP4_9ACTN|nr:sensor histidine kinase [Actinoplanes rishiriensis]GIE93197.1 two-component sensor histidine kinase [Actinoplanes rishiriensis]